MAYSSFLSDLSRWIRFDLIISRYNNELPNNFDIDIVDLLLLCDLTNALEMFSIFQYIYI